MSETFVVGASTFDLSALQTSLLAGAIAVLASGIVAFVVRRERPGVIGLPLAAAVVVSLRYELGAAAVPAQVIAGIVALFVGGQLLARYDRAQTAYLLLAPGALLLMMGSVDGVSVGTRIVIGLSASLSAVALADFDRRHARDALPIPLLLVSEVAVVMLAKSAAPGIILVGSTVLFLVLMVPTPQARFGAGGAAAVAGAYWWSVALIVSDRGGRLGAAWVALGFLILEPIARAITPAKRRPRTKQRDRDAPWLVVTTAIVAQGAMALYGVTVIAPLNQVDLVLLAVLPALIGGGLVALLVVPRSARQHSPGRVAPDVDLR